MKKIALTVSAVALALGMGAAQAAPKKAPAKTVFQCKNGATVTLTRLKSDEVRIHVSKVGSAKLKAAPTGSGERYITSKGLNQKGTEFQFKGPDGFLTYNVVKPYKNVVETSCRSK